MAAFVKSSILFAVLATVYSAPQIAYGPSAYAPAAYAPAVVHHVPVVQPHAHVVSHVLPHVVTSHVDVRQGQFIPIVSQNFDLQPDGSYSFSYEGADGSSRQESGAPRFQAQPGVEAPGGVAVQGRYAYASPEGPVQVDYVADENGYQPSGPNVHPEIQKAVAAQVAQARAEGPILPGPTAYHVPSTVVHHVPVVHTAIHPAVHPLVHSVSYPAAYPTPIPAAYVSSTFKA